MLTHSFLPEQRLWCSHQPDVIYFSLSTLHQSDNSILDFLSILLLQATLLTPSEMLPAFEALAELREESSRPLRNEGI